MLEDTGVGRHGKTREPRHAQTSIAQERVAYEEILEPGNEVPILTESVTDRNRSQREQTLRYLLSH